MGLSLCLVENGWKLTELRLISCCIEISIEMNGGAGGRRLPRPLEQKRQIQSKIRDDRNVDNSLFYISTDFGEVKLKIDGVTFDFVYGSLVFCFLPLGACRRAMLEVWVCALDQFFFPLGK